MVKLHFIMRHPSCHPFGSKTLDLDLPSGVAADVLAILYWVFCWFRPATFFSLSEVLFRETCDLVISVDWQ